MLTTDMLDQTIAATRIFSDGTCRVTEEGSHVSKVTSTRGAAR